MTEPAHGPSYAALLEENAKLKKHAEAMALDIERLIGWSDSSATYRADFPKGTT